MKARDLNAQEGKVLRYVVCHGEPVKAMMCVVKIPWSDLPHSPLVARAVLERLRAWGYVDRDKIGYIPTKKGREKITEANRKGWWQDPPSPEQMRAQARAD